MAGSAPGKRRASDEDEATTSPLKRAKGVLRMTASKHNIDPSVDADCVRTVKRAKSLLRMTASNNASEPCTKPKRVKATDAGGMDEQASDNIGEPGDDAVSTTPKKIAKKPMCAEVAEPSADERGVVTPKRVKVTAAGDVNTQVIEEARDSPLRRVRRAIAAEANKPAIESVDGEWDCCCNAIMVISLTSALSVVLGVKEFITNNPPKPGERYVADDIATSIMVKLRLVWVSYHQVNTGPVARLHLVNKRDRDKLEDLYADLRDNYESRKHIVDAELVTASVYGVSADNRNQLLPADGMVVRFQRVSARQLFAGKYCQFAAKLADTTAEPTLPQL